MQEDVAARVQADPRYHALVRRRARFGWLLAAIVFASFVGYLCLVAFDKAALAAPIGDGVTSVGIPIGIGLIVFAIILTGIYVARANSDFDPAMAEILKDAGA